MADKHVLVAGYFGAGNVGDELLLRQFTRWARERGAEVTALSVDPEHTRRTHGIPAVAREDLAQVAEAMLRSDLVALGGGGLFQDYHLFTIPDLFRYPGGISYYAQVVLMACQLKRRTLLWAMGIGPLKTLQAQAITREVVTAADSVSVRDPSSAALLREIGVERELLVAPDPIWAAEVSAEDAASRVARPATQRTLALVLRDWWVVPGWEDRLAQALRAVLREGWACDWVAFQTHGVSDVDSLRRMIHRVGPLVPHTLHAGLGASETMAVVHRADAVLAMRLHALITGAATGRPLASFEYDQKVASAAEDLQLAESARARLSDSPQRLEQVLGDLLRAAEAGQGLAAPEGRAQQLAREALLHRDLLRTQLEAVPVSPPAGAELQLRSGHDWLATWSLREREEQRGRLCEARFALDRVSRELEATKGELEATKGSLADTRGELEAVQGALRASEQALAASVEQARSLSSLAEQEQARLGCRLQSIAGEGIGPKLK